MKTFAICLIEDEEILRESLKDDLVEAGYHVKAFENPVLAFEQIKKNSFDFVICDIRLPVMSGLELLVEIKKVNPALVVIMMTAHASVENAVQAMKQGAYDFLTKPFTIDELLLTLERVKEVVRLKSQNLQFQNYFSLKYPFQDIIGISESTLELRRHLEVISGTNSTILITGETGTGKELVANIIHYNSARKGKPLIKVSCAILSEEMIGSELFGHEKGSFTGAEKRRIGRFEAADGGTIYLDDIDDVPLNIQVKLLRVLQEQEIERLGSNEPIKIDVRVIASTKADLRELVKAGKFREDLYYRLKILPVDLLPLRERKDDILPLFQHFLNVFAPQKNFRIRPETESQVILYKWPGNIRELKNLVERISILVQTKEISLRDLPIEFHSSASNIEIQSGLEVNSPFFDLVDAYEKKLIQKALAETGNNKAKAADLLSLPVSTLKNKIEKLGLTEA